MKRVTEWVYSGAGSISLEQVVLEVTCYRSSGPNLHVHSDIFATVLAADSAILCPAPVGAFLPGLGPAPLRGFFFWLSRWICRVGKIACGDAGILARSQSDFAHAVGRARFAETLRHREGTAA